MKLLVLSLFFLQTVFSVTSGDLRSTKCKLYEDNCNLNGACKGLLDHILSVCTQGDGAEFQKCATTELTKKAGMGEYSRSKAHIDMQYLEVCYYEESKDLGTFSYYKNGAPVREGDQPAGFEQFDFAWTPKTTNLDTNTKMSCDVAVKWDSNTFDIQPKPPKMVSTKQTLIDEAIQSTADCKARCDGNDSCASFDWNNSKCTVTVNLPDTVTLNKIPHINIHACQMTESQKTCSAKFYNATYVHHGYWSTVESPSDVLLNLLPLTKGKWRIMGHIYFYVKEGNDYPKWDVAKVSQVEITQGMTTTPNPKCLRVAPELKQIESSLLSCSTDAGLDADALCVCHQRAARQLRETGCSDDAVISKCDGISNGATCNCKDSDSSAAHWSMHVLFVLFFAKLLF